MYSQEKSIICLNPFENQKYLQTISRNVFHLFLKKKKNEQLSKVLFSIVFIFLNVI